MAMLLSTLTTASAAPTTAATPDPVMVTVNGATIKRADVEAKTWQRYNAAVLNEMVEELLVKQAAERLQVKPDPLEIDAHIKKIQAQFPNEAAFKERLASSGTSLDEFRSQIKAQVLRDALVSKAQGIKVSDEEVKDYFNTNKERFSSPDSVRLRTILVGTEKEANDFLVALRAGADFAQLASKVSLDQGSKVKGGDLGYISKGMLQPDLEKAVSTLKLGAISEPIKVPAGFVLFKKEEEKSAKQAVFSEMEKDLRQNLLSKKISSAWPAYLKELRDNAKITPSAQTPTK
jgi:foldase protein PrsA